MTKPDDSSHWLLKPKIGLGNITFGMNEGAVDALGIYGAATASRNSNPIPDDESTAFLKSLGFGANDISDALSKQTALMPQAVVTEARPDGLVLEYDKTGLFEILADIKTDKLNYDGLIIFSAPPLAVVKHLATALAEQPLISENEVVFPNNLIFLFEFVKVSKDGSSYLDGSRSDRSIIWRSKPRDLGEDLSKYKLMNL